jgi:hypothetical protein
MPAVFVALMALVLTGFALGLVLLITSLTRAESARARADSPQEPRA